MSGTEPFQLSNGRYVVELKESGAGLSSCRSLALNRWSGEAGEARGGFFIYLRDEHNLWSAGLQPSMSKPDQYQVSRSPDRFVIERRDAGIATTLTVSVSNGEDAEIRRLRLENTSGRARRIEVTSLIEVALAPRMADLVHPAFMKLFVQTQLAGNGAALIARRRPRDANESWPALMHSLTGAPVQGWETDRLAFIGRGRGLNNPAMVMRGTVGNVLDPVFSLRTTLELAPGESRDLTFKLEVLTDPSKYEAVAGAPLDGSVPFPSMPESRRQLVDLKSGFNADFSEYVMHLPWSGDGLVLPPMPWTNVIANEHFGFLVTETGAGCTWSRNSQANRLTPWSNDPVCDPHGEALYLRDESTGEFWSPLPGPAPAPGPYEVRHGFGYSNFASSSHGLEQDVTMFAARHDPVKFVRVKLRQNGDNARSMSLFSYQHLVLGLLPETPSTIRTWLRSGVLCATNTKPGDFADGIAFSYAITGAGTAAHMSCDRPAFVGENGILSSPFALRRPTLDGNCNGSTDPCFARQLQFILQPGQSAEFCIVLGEATSEAALDELLARYRDPASADAALSEVRLFWKSSVQTLQVRTPRPEIDSMLNGWLPYQALACRIWGRTAYYQSGGAFGYRDQLQDAGNLCFLWPDLTRRQILLHAAHQFSEGDVLHWWHEEPIGRGIRTHFSDDLLWLPYMTSHYVQTTGDAALLDETVGFLDAPVLAPGEGERYLKAVPGQAQASLYQHCCLALDRSLTRGAHGLPLMGAGDWNDGMNRIGSGGRGESVWLGFFLFTILADFIALTRSRGDMERALRYEAYRANLGHSLNEAGWDGGWYRRAYYDDGTPLGTSQDTECRIDGLVQAWSVLSGAAPPDRASQALEAAEAQLISESDGLIRLLTPPFVDTPHDPGYIKGYVAGVRENGGQYTHAACWMVAALAKAGQRNRAGRLLALLSPHWHTRNAEAVERYKVEPYVIAADVYGAAPHVGRGGWTWYTGSAAWAYRVAVESVLGLRLEGGSTLVLRPCIPDDWPGYQIQYRPPGYAAQYCFEVNNPGKCSEHIVSCTVDGAEVQLADGLVRLPVTRDGILHRVVVTLGNMQNST